MGAAAKFTKILPALRRFSDFPLLLAFMIGLYLAAIERYVIFHSLLESALIAVTFSTFAFTWNARRLESGYLQLIGVACLPIGVCEVLHMLAYPGLTVFVDGNEANLAPQLWLAGRFVLVAAVGVASLLGGRPVRPGWAFAALSLLAGGLILSIFTGHFPRAFIAGEGLTRFKVLCEYAIAISLLLACLLLMVRDYRLPRSTRILLGTYYICAAATSLAFSSYFAMYDHANMLGHYILLLGTYAFYKAIVETGISRPFDLLFRELTEAIRARDEFLSIASHELKTPLTPIKLQLQGIQRLMLSDRLSSLSPAQLNRMLETSDRQINRLTHLVDNLLDVSRISAGKLQLQRETVDVTQLFREIVERHQGEIKTAKVVLDTPVPPVVLEADLIRLDQVITNLFTNALKYAPGSRVELGARREPDGSSLIWVQDSGPGVPRAHRRAIFDRFERVPGLTSASGLGLGLFISRQIVEAHGGQLRLADENGNGSRFEIRLPQQ